MDNRTERAYDLIKRNYRDRLVLSVLADKVKLSPYYFHRLFKKEMGMTPQECLKRARLEKSAHLMKSGSGWSLSEIAADCGFSSLSAFSRAFSQQFGMSPMAFSRSKQTSIHINIVDPPELDVKVVYLPDTLVYYNVTSISNKDLHREFKNARSTCELNKVSIGDRQIGIATHVTFHYPEDSRNYYAGIEVKGKVPEKYADRVFLLPKGKYAVYSTTESIQKVRENAMWFKINWMDDSGCTRRDMFTFEEFDPSNKPSDYPFLKRKVYVPIKKK